MSSSTATIRVPVRTRDRLAAQARERGLSLAALVTELASRTEHEEIFRAEREATRAEATVDTVHGEETDWDRAIDDGIF